MSSLETVTALKVVTQSLFDAQMYLSTCNLSYLLPLFRLFRLSVCLAHTHLHLCVCVYVYPGLLHQIASASASAAMLQIF